MRHLLDPNGQNRRLVVLASCAVAFSRGAGAQLGSRPLRLGYLAVERNERLYGALLAGLRGLGYAEGTSLLMLDHSTKGRPEELDAAGPTLVASRPDVIVTAGSTATRSAMRATTKIPIVFAPGGSDVVRTGLVASLAKPGGNVSGISLDTLALTEKRLELLRDTFAQVRRVAVLANGSNPNLAVQWDATRSAAAALGLEPTLLTVSVARELDAAFTGISQRDFEALHVFSDAAFDVQRERIVRLAAARKLPSVYEHRAFTESGGLISYGPNLDRVSARAAEYVDRIVKGTKISDLPVETPTQFELVVNLKAAKALDITIPTELVNRADEVIE